jgi:FkbM family methyltransferase
MTLARVRTLWSQVRKEWQYTKMRFGPAVSGNERINKYWLRKYLPPFPVIVDAGAHDGADSIEMCRIFPGARIFAFEPVPEIFLRLKQNTKHLSRINSFNLALSHHNGKQVMHISSGTSDGSSSFLLPNEHLLDHPDVFFNTDLSVQTVTLDSWAAEQSIDHVDFLWLDMQGYELEVIKASTVILPTVKAIHMEVSTRMTYEGVPLYDEVKSWMENQGFQVEVEAIPKGWDMGNVLFVRR